MYVLTIVHTLFIEIQTVLFTSITMNEGNDNSKENDPQIMEGGITTKPYPKDNHPLDVIQQETARYETRLRTLLIALCGGDPYKEGNSRSSESHGTGGVPDGMMQRDLGTGIPKHMHDGDETIELKTDEYRVVEEGEALIYEVAFEIANHAKSVLHEMDTEKIAVPIERQEIVDEVTSYFDSVIGNVLQKSLPDERLRMLLALQTLQENVCELVVATTSEDKDRYLMLLKNAINYIVDGVAQRGINKSVTLQINV